MPPREPADEDVDEFVGVLPMLSRLIRAFEGKVVVVVVVVVVAVVVVLGCDDVDD